jgi:hypothetical protein
VLDEQASGLLRAVPQKELRNSTLEFSDYFDTGTVVENFTGRRD